MLAEATGGAIGERTAGTTLRDEAAIIQTWVRLANAWGRGDASAISALLDRDCDHRILTANGRLRRGRDEFDRIFRRAFAERTPNDGRALKFSVSSVRLIGADVALLDGTLLFTHAGRRDGRGLPCGSEPFTAIMKRHTNGWLIAACRVGTLVPM
jgi:uncharacterized protein (TIGR02246 family)